MERFVAAPHNAGRAASLRWAQAWQLAAMREAPSPAPSLMPRSVPGLSHAQLFAAVDVDLP
jgi:hypothetical protein